MLNPHLDYLTDYPFQRLRDLLDGIAPPKDVEPAVLSIGEPRHGAPELVRGVLNDAFSLWGSYPPPNGSDDFRRAVAEWLTRRYDLPADMIDPQTAILPLSGTREGLYMVAPLTIPRRKDNAAPAVLTPNPFYQVYVGAALMAGGDPYTVPAGPETGFLPNYTALPSQVLRRSALAYVCSPANPQGSVAGLDYWKDLIRKARAFDFVIAADECYSEIYSGPTPPVGVLEACKALGGSLDNVLVFNSLSKRSSAPGLRSGFVAGDPKLIAGFARLRAYGGAAIPGPVLAASAALWRDEAHVHESLEAYRGKFALAEKILGARFGAVKPAGGFFLWLNVGDGEAAAKALWRDAGVKVLPGAYLGRKDLSGGNPGAPYVRVALVETLERTEAALTRLAAAVPEGGFSAPA